MFTEPDVVGGGLDTGRLITSIQYPVSSLSRRLIVMMEAINVGRANSEITPVWEENSFLSGDYD
jgi:hypothetical protein